MNSYEQAVENGLKEAPLEKVSYHERVDALLQHMRADDIATLVGKHINQRREELKERLLNQRKIIDLIINSLDDRSNTSRTAVHTWGDLVTNADIFNTALGDSIKGVASALRIEQGD